jgi:hypothetical protein
MKVVRMEFNLYCNGMGTKVVIEGIASIHVRLQQSIMGHFDRSFFGKQYNRERYHDLHYSQESESDYSSGLNN